MLMLQAYAEDIPEKRPGKAEISVLAGSLFVIAGSYAYSSFASTWNVLAPRCLFHWITKVPCLLCGMTRSFAATARLDLPQAFSYHFLGPVFFAGICVAGAAAAWSLASGKRLSMSVDTGTRKLLGWGLLGLLIIAWIAKLIVFGRNV